MGREGWTAWAFLTWAGEWEASCRWEVVSVLMQCLMPILRTEELAVDCSLNLRRTEAAEVPLIRGQAVVQVVQTEAGLEVEVRRPREVAVQRRIVEVPGRIDRPNLCSLLWRCPRRQSSEAWECLPRGCHLVAVRCLWAEVHRCSLSLDSLLRLPQPWAPAAHLPWGDRHRQT